MLIDDLLFEGVCTRNLAHNMERADRQPTLSRARAVKVDGLDLTNSGCTSNTGACELCLSSPRIYCYLIWPWGSALWTRRRSLVVEFSHLQITSPSNSAACTEAALLTVDSARSYDRDGKKTKNFTKPCFQRNRLVGATRIGCR